MPMYPGLAVESGIWTPVLAGSTTAGTQTYSDQTGRYQVVGDVVTAWLSIILSAKDPATAGTIRITGLPYIVSAVVSGVVVTSQVTYAASTTAVCLFATASQAYMTLRCSASGVGYNPVSASGIADSSVIIGTLTYRRG